MSLVNRVWRDESGAGVNEYALLLIAVIAALIAAIYGFSSHLGPAFSASGASATRF